VNNLLRKILPQSGFERGRCAVQKITEKFVSMYVQRYDRALKIQL